MANLPIRGWTLVRKPPILGQIDFKRDPEQTLCAQSVTSVTSGKITNGVWCSIKAAPGMKAAARPLVEAGLQTTAARRFTVAGDEI
jgi:hypothetical protein